MFVLYLLDWLFCIIVFSCIAQSKSLVGSCPFDDNEDTCSYGVFIGVVGFLFATAFMCLELDFAWNFVERSQLVRPVYIFQIIFSALWSVLFFIMFCSLCSKWRNVDLDRMKSGAANARGAISFSFFAWLSWSATTYFLYKAFKADGIHFHDSEYQSMDGMNLNENNGYQDPVTRNVNTRNPMLNLDASIIPDNNNANDSLSHTGVYTPPVVPNANETFITGV